MPRQDAVSVSRRKPGKKRAEPKLSKLQKPANMTLEEWQIELRRQFGREQPFKLANHGDHPVFSEFRVLNPQSRNTYTVHIRGQNVGDNSCSCPDFATNTLGTCKHIEFTLPRLEGKRGAAAQLRAGFQPPSSEIYLQYGSRREVRFRPGSDCPVELARLAADVFDAEGALLPEVAGRFESFLAEAVELEPDLTLRRRRAGFRRRGARRRAPAPQGERSLLRAASAVPPSRIC